MKRIIALLLSVVMMCSFIVTASAESELAGAKSYTLGTSRSGSIVEGDEKDVYEFELLDSGKITINFSGEIERVQLKLYDSNGQEIWSDRPGWNSTTQSINYQNDIWLCEGEYYLSISKYYGLGNYDFTITQTGTYESFVEDQGGSNNTVKESDTISHGQNYIGCIALNDEVDIYNFELPYAGKMDIKFNANVERLQLKLYDENGIEIWSDRPGWNSTTQSINYQNSIYLCKGKYYFSVSKYYGHGEYDFTLLLTGSNESFAEKQGGSNNKLNEAEIININQKYNGALALNDEVDIYRIVINNPSVTFNLSGSMERVALKLYDSNGQEIWSDRPGWNSTTQLITYSKEHKLASGLYYLSVSKYYGHGNYKFYFTNGGKVLDTTSTNSVITVKLNGSYIDFDQPPVLENGRTLVPLRAIFEALGAKVDWEAKTQTVTATKDGTKIVLQIGSNKMYVNGALKVLDVPAKLINSRTLVPVRAVSEAFGCKVDWDGNTRTVIITE